MEIEKIVLCRISWHISMCDNRCIYKHVFIYRREVIIFSILLLLLVQVVLFLSQYSLENNQRSRGVRNIWQNYSVLQSRIGSFTLLPNKKQHAFLSVIFFSKDANSGGKDYPKRWSIGHNHKHFEHDGKQICITVSIVSLLFSLCYRKQ